MPFLCPEPIITTHTHISRKSEQKMPTKRMTKKKDHNRKPNRKVLKGNRLRVPRNTVDAPVEA
jgi:hypothetical protein